MNVELREWLDNLLNVVDGLADDVRWLARNSNHDVEDLSAHGVSTTLIQLQRRLYELPLDEESP